MCVHRCYLCGDKEDNTSHIYGDCKVVKQALIKLWDTLGIKEAEELVSQDSYLDFALMNWGGSTTSTTSNTTTITNDSAITTTTTSITTTNIATSTVTNTTTAPTTNTTTTTTISSDATTTTPASTTTHNAKNKNTTLKISQEYTQFKIGLQYVFNFLVWEARESIKDGREAEDGVINRIFRSTLNRVSRLAPAALTDEQLPGNRLSEEEKGEFASRVRSYGAAGKRTPAQKAAAQAAAAKIQDGLPEHAIEIWTDGSRIGKSIPGPAGAGAVIMRKGAVQQELTFYLGDSTNQTAELWAIGGALESLPSLFMGDREVHVFTDSQFSIDCISGKYFSPTHFHRIAKIRKNARQLGCTVSYHHVAGHAGIPGNEHADKLANVGARYSKNNTNFEELSLDDILEHYSFDYLKLDGIT